MPPSPFALSLFPSPFILPLSLAFPDPLPSPSVIRFAHVYKSYPNGALALKDVSFRVAKGEFVFLTGHSGAGKSTIMKLLFAEQRPTSGEVRVSGYSVSDLRADEIPRLRRRLGVVFKDFRLLEDRSAA